MVGVKMGNKDGIMECMALCETNKVLSGKGFFFSFAYGNEIALKTDDYYILNCGNELWEEVNNLMRNEPSLETVKQFWMEKSKDYEISDWSGSFKNLEKVC